MKKKMLISALSLFLGVSLIGCTPIVEEKDTVSVIDMVGDTVEVKKNPQNVAVISRAVADMMVGFGLGDKVDGMYKSILDNEWSTHLYPGAKDYYSYGYQDSAELFLSRGVDLVIAPEKYIADDLRIKGVKAITMNLYGTPTYESVLTKIPDLISAIWPDTLNQVNEWKDELTTALNQINNKLEDVKTTRSIHYVRGDKDKGIGYTDTVGSLVETIYQKYFKMNYLGNTFENANPSIESIMAADPDVIVVGGKYQQKIINDIYHTEPQNKLTAVKENKVYNIPISFVMWEQNSIALPLFIYDQANKLYPDLFDYDLVQKTTETYTKWFDYNLTTEEVNYMLEGKSPQGI